MKSLTLLYAITLSLAIGAGCGSDKPARESNRDEQHAGCKHGDHEHSDHEHGDHGHGDHKHNGHEHDGHKHGDHEHKSVEGNCPAEAIVKFETLVANFDNSNTKVQLEAIEQRAKTFVNEYPLGLKCKYTSKTNEPSHLDILQDVSGLINKVIVKKNEV